MNFDEAKKLINPPEAKLTVPTYDRRHVSWIREGRQSAEVFCRDPKRREELGLPYIVVEPD